MAPDPDALGIHRRLVLFRRPGPWCSAAPRDQGRGGPARTHERPRARADSPPGLIGVEKIASVTLTGPGGKSLPAQWPRPGLLAGAPGGEGTEGRELAGPQGQIRISPDRSRTDRVL